MAALVRLRRPALTPGELHRVACYVLLPPALVVARCDCPDVVMLSRGRCCGLILRQPVGVLSAWQRAHLPTLRAAGMSVAVVDSVEDALAALAGFGLALRPCDLGSGHRDLGSGHDVP